MTLASREICVSIWNRNGCVVQYSCGFGTRCICEVDKCVNNIEVFTSCYFLTINVNFVFRRAAATAFCVQPPLCGPNLYKINSFRDCQQRANLRLQTEGKHYYYILFVPLGPEYVSAWIGGPTPNHFKEKRTAGCKCSINFI